VEALVFFVCAAAVLTGALGVILGRNPVHSALFLLLTLVSIAVLYLQQHAALVAAIQIVVYASAIVVLFLFVITLLGVDKHEAPDDAHPIQRVAAIVVGVLALIGILVLVHGNRWVTGAHSTRGALGTPESGNVESLAKSLFTDFVWAFEITAVLLVIAVVGSVVLARRSGHRAEAPDADADTVTDDTSAVAATEPERTSS
jgi:NADH-quinone oxidoreductase subunit J